MKEVPNSIKEKVDINLLRKVERNFSNFTFEIKEDDIFRIAVKTILSQNTSDKLRDRAFSNLEKRYGKDLKGLYSASIKEIEKEIRVCGLGKLKATRIKNLLKYDISKVCEMEDSKAFEFLISIDGIGPKSAAVILAMGCKKNFFPVDTHISRILKRIGVVPQNWTREKIYFSVNPIVKDKLRTHLALIDFGRKICKKNPLCEKCNMRKFCFYYTHSSKSHYSSKSSSSPTTKS